MEKTIPTRATKAFALVNAGGHIWPSSCRWLRNEVVEFVNSEPGFSWPEARKLGWRIAKVVIFPDQETPS